MAFGGNIPEAFNSSRFVRCELCDEVQEATSHCDECLINFCERCVAVHSKLPSKRSHLVENGICYYNMEFELCPEDGQKMSFFCRTCVVRVCPDCELTSKNHSTHSVITLVQHVGNEKEKLLERLDKVTTKTESVSYIPNDIKSMTLQIELKWLERKELIRHEFASLFETISDCRERLLADMEQDVQKSLHKLEKLDEDHKAVLATSCQLTDDCITAIQNLPRLDFLRKFPEFLASVEELEHLVASLPSAEDQMPSFLKMPFSLHTEKVHLNNSLHFKAFSCYQLKAKDYQHFVPYDRVYNEMTVSSLIHTPHPKNLPPSTVVCYQVEISSVAKLKLERVLRTQNGLKAQDAVFNGAGGFRLFPGILYMVKIRPTFTCTTHQGKQSVDGRTLSISIVTGTPNEGIFTAVQAVGKQIATDSSSIITTCKTQTICSANEKSNHTFKRLIASCGRKKRSIKSTLHHLTFKASQPLWFTERDVQMLRTYVPTSKLSHSLLFSVPWSQADEHFQWQNRFRLHCSFEEARLLEDKMLSLGVQK